MLIYVAVKKIEESCKVAVFWQKSTFKKRGYAMRDKRSINKKNLLGGFLGGVCGILAFGYVHPALLPIGVLAGVVTGWWYEAIWNMVVKNISDSLEFSRNSIRRCHIFIGACAQGSLWVLWRKRNKEDDSLSIFYNWFLVPTLWLVTRSIACWRWLNRHPMNRAYALQALLISSQVISIVAVSVFLVYASIPEMISGVRDGYGGWTPARLPSWIDYVAMTVMFCLIPVGVAVGYHCQEFSDRTTKDFYQDFDRYVSNGPVKYFFHHLVKSVAAQVRAYVIVLLSIIYFSGAGILFFAILVVPFAIFIWTIKGINEIIMRKGHWLCLGTTMAVTTSAAYFFHPYFGNASILWMAALAAGMISGGVTEGMRRVIAWSFENTDVGRQYSNAKSEAFLNDRLSPYWRSVLAGWEKTIAKSLSVN